MIYLDDEGRSRAFATLARLVADGGLLFLGHADRLEDARGMPFEPTGDKGAFAFRKGTGGPKRSGIRPPSKLFSSPLPPGEGPGVRGVARPVASRKNVSGPHPTRHDHHPGPLPGGEGGRGKEPKKPATPAESPSSVLERASGLADLGRYDEATSLVEGLIKGGGAGAPAYFLLGLIAQAAGHRDRAEGHYAQGDLPRSPARRGPAGPGPARPPQGDIAGEAAYRKRAERVLARKVAP